MIKLKREDVKNIVQMNRSRNITWIEIYKRFFSYTMDRQVELDRKKETMWMANISSPITYQICMAVYGMYQDSKVAFEVYRTIKKAKGEELTEEDSSSSENISNAIINLFESIYEKSDGSEEFDMSVLDAIILGNGFGGIWYEKSEDTYEVIGENLEKITIKETVNMPNIYRILPLNFYTELSAVSQQKAKVNIIRKIKTTDRINKDYKIYWVTYEKKENTWEILEGKDWNMVIRSMMFNNMPHATTLSSLWLTNTYGSNGWTWFDWQKHTDIWTDNQYKIGDDLHEVYEIHTDKTMQVYIDGEDLWLFDRLGPWKVKPVYKLSFRDWLNGLYDIGAGFLSYPYHKVMDAFLNLRIDNDRLTAAAPLLVNSDETTFDGMDTLERYPGKIIKVKDITQSIKPSGFVTSGGTVANSEVEMLAKTVQDAVGISWYKMWVQQKVERSAKWVNELIESSDAAMKSFISSIAKAKWFIAKYTVMLALHYMDEDTLEKMSGMNWLKDEIDLTDFINDYRFNFNILSVSSLRERQEIELLKNTIRDYAQIMRPDGTPVLNQEEAFKEILEKARLSEKLYMSPEDAVAHMKQQIQSNADLTNAEAELNPNAVAAWRSIIGQQQWKPTVGAAPAPWVQWWSLGEWMWEVTNFTWANQETWQI